MYILAVKIQRSGRPYNYDCNGVCRLYMEERMWLPPQFCGACATIYRIKGDNELKTCLACQTQVQEGNVCGKYSILPDR